MVVTVISELYELSQLSNDDSFSQSISLDAFEALDNFALLTCQSYNRGDETGWFELFRGGLYGFYSRVYGVKTHYSSVHAWLPRLRSPSETEHHTTSILFNLDSAVECLTFALNALGFAVQPQGFRDVTDSGALRNIGPKDVLGNPESNPPREPLGGYAQIFPTLQHSWIEFRPRLEELFEFHDVSKHRATIYSGGNFRNDPPEGFFELMGVEDDDSKRFVYSPHQEIILTHDPKTPRRQRQLMRYEDRITLEELTKDCMNFLERTGELALQDSRDNIELQHSEFQNNHEGACNAP